MTQSTSKHRYLIIGAGIQSHAIVHYLLGCESAEGITVVDRDMSALGEIGRRFSSHRARVAILQMDASDTDAVTELMAIHDVAVSASSYKLNVGLTRAAIAAHCHLVDLGGNDRVVAEQFALHEDALRAGVAVMPDSGVAPGAASILTAHGLERFPEARSVRIYCGGLPQNPAGPLKYAKMFAMSGLINEYKEPCRIIRDGKLHLVSGLDCSDKPEINFPGLGMLEAAYTSGGVSTMVETYAGRLDNLSYETLRYPGDVGEPSHWDIMRMYRDNGWFEDRWTKFHVKDVDMTPREVLEAYLDQTLPREQPDYLALMVELESPGRLKLRLSVLDSMSKESGLSAMARTTGYTAAIEARMLAEGSITQRGVLRRESSGHAAQFIKAWGDAGIHVKYARIKMKI